MRILYHYKIRRKSCKRQWNKTVEMHKIMTTSQLLHIDVTDTENGLVISSEIRYGESTKVETVRGNRIVLYEYSEKADSNRPCLPDTNQ